MVLFQINFIAHKIECMKKKNQTLKHFIPKRAGRTENNFLAHRKYKITAILICTSDDDDEQ